jgi:hypothetical protein
VYELASHAPEEDEREDAHGAVVPDVEDEQGTLPQEQNHSVEELIVLRSGRERKSD